MKRCPTCGTVSPDDEPTCGICGHDLSNASFESVEAVQRDQNADVAKERAYELGVLRAVRRRRIASTLFQLGIGIFSIILGFVIIGQFNSIYGVLFFLLGIFWIWAGFLRPYWNPRISGKR